MARQYNLTNRMVSDADARRTRKRAIDAKGPVELIDPVVDKRWAQLHHDSDATNNYYDYFYSGQDIRVYIAELGNHSEFGDLPLQSLGFSIEQQKMPVYGYASYTYDAVMRGTRIVSGQFTLISRYPGYMKRVLTQAAKNRSNRQGRLRDGYGRGLTDDDKNINKYWDRHIDVGVIAARENSEWSIHPPFTLVVVYGIQDTSTTVDQHLALYNAHEKDNALFQDHNQRLVPAASNRPDRFYLDACELQSVQHAYTPDGQLVVETYQFFARDYVLPTKPVGVRRNIR